MSTCKICPNLEELDPIKPWKKGRSDRPMVGKTVCDYHCPVENCLYNINSDRHFQTMKSLRQHYRKVHAPKVYKCESCQQGFAHPCDLKCHQVSCGQSFACGSCDRTYSSKESLMTHARRKQHILPRVIPAKEANKQEEFFADRTVAAAVVVFVNCNNGLVQPPVDDISRQRPCLLLPKSPLLNFAIPAMTPIILNESATSSKPKTTSETQTVDVPQTILAGCDCNNQKHKQQRSTQTKHGVKRRKKISRLITTSTQTTISGRTLQNHTRRRISRKANLRATRTARALWCGANEVGVSIDNLDDSIDHFQPKRFGAQREAVGSSAAFSSINEMWYSHERRNQPDPNTESLGSLDVDVGLSLSLIASCATQTSPHAAGSTGLLTLQDILNVDSMQEREMVSVLQGTSSDITHLNCETQTDWGHGCMLCDEHHKSTESDDSIIFADIQTQTTGDLESIPYEHLLTNMETQTGNAYFLSVLDFSNIETQTPYETAPMNVSALESEFVDMHTQTKTNENCDITETHFTDTQTQTLGSQPMSDARGLFINSHTQTI